MTASEWKRQRVTAECGCTFELYVSFVNEAATDEQVANVYGQSIWWEHPPHTAEHAEMCRRRQPADGVPAFFLDGTTPGEWVRPS